MDSRIKVSMRLRNAMALVAMGGLSLMAVAQPPPGGPPPGGPPPGGPPGPQAPLPVPQGPVTYQIDPGHTYPSFEADHRGISIWRGKFNKSSGTVVLDRTGHAGTVDITVDINSINFGLDKMNEHALSSEIFDAAKYPTATYHGTFAKFKGDAPTEIKGELTLHGVTKPVNLVINKFACKPGMGGRGETCGGDASTSFNRADFGVDFGAQMGMDMTTRLQIQVEAGRTT